MKHLFAAVAVTVMASSAAFAQHGGDASAKPAAKAAKKEVCAVMGDKFDVNAKTLKSTYKGKTYYFCCPGCKPTFDKNPEKYAKAAKPAAPAKSAKPAKPAKPAKKTS